MSIMDKGVLRLVQCLDALFPVGGYTLSNGMETYVQYGTVKDELSLIKHLKAYLYNISLNELAFSAMAANGENIEYLDELCSAVRSPRELREGSIRQCQRFIKLQTGLCGSVALKGYGELIESGCCDGHYCIAMGLFIRELGVELNTALQLYAYNIISCMANHAVKLVPLRQLDGQRALQKTAEEIPEAVKRAIGCSYDDLGASGAGFDISSMRHEKLYSRLYIS